MTYWQFRTTRKGVSTVYTLSVNHAVLNSCVRCENSHDGMWQPFLSALQTGIRVSTVWTPFFVSPSHTATQAVHLHVPTVSRVYPGCVPALSLLCPGIVHHVVPALSTTLSPSCPPTCPPICMAAQGEALPNALPQRYRPVTRDVTGNVSRRVTAASPVRLCRRLHHRLQSRLHGAYMIRTGRQGAFRGGFQKSVRGAKVVSP